MENKNAPRKPQGNSDMQRNTSAKKPMQNAKAPAKKSSAKSIAADITKNASGILSNSAKKILTYILNVFLTLLLIGIITGSAMACALAIYVKNYVDPTFDVGNLEYDSNLTTSIYFQQKNASGETEWVEWEDERIHGSENRLWISYEEIPENLINAFVSVEDKTFFKHNGINVKRTVGAVFGFLTSSSSYGGSTITQQLIKNVTGEDDVTIQRKIQEILRAFNFEKKHSKEEILEMYLNTIYFNRGSYGIVSAAHTYFNKEVKDLTLNECAALAAIPQNPSKFDPISHPDFNAERRETVLLTMYENKDIDKTYTLDEIREAKAAELVTVQQTEDLKTSNVHSWFVDTLINDIIDDLQTTYKYDNQTASNMLYSGGLKIYCTIDRNIQNIIDEVYQNPDNFPSHGEGVQVESAMTVIDQYTGHVVGIVGGRGVKDTPLAFNRATMAKRQPGSSIKPLSAYSQALEKGLINYSTVIDDTPFRCEKDAETGENKTWPNNYNNKYEGLCTVQNAVRDSKNTIAVKVVDMIGTKNCYDFLVNKFHLSTLVPEDMDYAPLSLGGFTKGVTVRDMAGAYSAIANNGVYNKPTTYTRVLDSEDNVLLESGKNSEIILSEDTCAVMTRLLQDVVTSGTGSALTLKKQVNCAGKTGTTTNSYDLYFCGYTPYYTASCWVGYDVSKALEKFSSGQRKVSAALYLWDAVMTRAHEQIIAQGNVKKFTDYLTKQLVTRTYCKDSGLLVGANCGLDLRGNRTATGYYAPSNIPTETCQTHVLVGYCNSSNCVATDRCPSTRNVALINVTREFPMSVEIADTQYTYRDLPLTVPRASALNVPYYYNLYTANGKFCGYSAVDKYANASCISH